MSAQTLHFVPSADFRSRTAEAVGDPQLRRSFRGAMDFLQGKRSAQFPDANELEALRTLGEAVRQHTLQNLPQLLEQLEQMQSVFQRLLLALQQCYGLQVELLLLAEDLLRL